MMSKIKFVEVNPEPYFNLQLSVEDAVDLYRIMRQAEEDGNEDADKFLEVLQDFAANSNYYAEYLPANKR